jgi:hypothetical protein
MPQLVAVTGRRAVALLWWGADAARRMNITVDDTPRRLFEDARYMASREDKLRLPFVGVSGVPAHQSGDRARLPSP